MPIQVFFYIQPPSTLKFLRETLVNMHHLLAPDSANTGNIVQKQQDDWTFSWQRGLIAMWINNTLFEQGHMEQYVEQGKEDMVIQDDGPTTAESVADMVAATDEQQEVDGDEMLDEAQLYQIMRGDNMWLISRTPKTE